LTRHYAHSDRYHIDADMSPGWVVTESSKTNDRRTRVHARPTLLLVLAGLFAGAVMFLYVGIVPAGQPADEPSHWSTVQYYEHERRLPELGNEGVTYEAQMGPVYYSLAAMVAWPVEQLAGTEAAFYAVRSIGVVLVVLTIYLTYVLGLMVFPTRRLESAIAATFAGVLPPMFAVGASVQNDQMTLVLATLAAIVAIRALDPDSSLRMWALAGALIGLAVLSRVSAVVVLVTLVLVVVCAPTRRRAQLRGLGVAIVCFVVVCGWWVLRNQLLYGDLSGRGGLERVGLSFPPIPFGLRSLFSWLRDWVATMWMPTQYYRNDFSAPRALQVVIAVWTVVLLLLVARGAVLGLARRRLGALSPGLLFLVVWVVSTVVGFSIVVWTWSGFSPRITYVALPGGALLAVVAIARATASSAQRYAVAGVTAVLMLVCIVFAAVEVTQIPHHAFWLEF
jgi:4-amino-4-deoxy-L-arabinose transferase-like glycosyltransferase